MPSILAKFGSGLAQGGPGLARRRSGATVHNMTRFAGHALGRHYIAAILLSLSCTPAGADTAEVAPVPAYPASVIKLPAGFNLNVFARLTALDSELTGARMMAIGPDGNLYLSISSANKVVMLPDRNHDGVADEVVLVADKLNAPHGLAFVDGALLVANQDGVVKLQQQGGRWPATAALPFISGLASGGHTLKTIKLGPDGYLYLNVGSSCNVCVESDATRATILRYSVDGKPAGAVSTLGRHAPNAVWASGLRNSQGFAWQPTTGNMYATNNGQDMRSGVKGTAVDDELPPEHLNRIEAGKHYGWPYCWGQTGQDALFSDPNFVGPDGYCAAAQAPAMTFVSHSTPLGIAFLSGSKFPADYQSDAIVALHGSWNRKQPSGYKLVRVQFKQDKPVQMTDFASGWLSGKQAWGRPVDVLVGKDGALYVSDDRAGLVYRIQYAK